MKKGMKKMRLSIDCKNTDMLSEAIGSIDVRTKSGIDTKIGGEDWNGISWETLSFFAIPAEVSQIRDEIETEFSVKFV